MVEQGMRLREQHPEWDARILDLHYHEIARDPMACMRRIYDHFDLPLGEEAERRMHGYIDAHPKNEHGTHRYSPQAFGLEPEVIEERFKAYCECYGVEPEPYA